MKSHLPHDKTHPVGRGLFSVGSRVSGKQTCTANFPQGSTVIEVNPEVTEFSRGVSYAFRGTSAEILPQLVDGL